MPWTKLVADSIKWEGLAPLEEGKRVITFAEALREAQKQAMETDPGVLIMGEDVDGPTGVFGSTLDLHKEFGRKRVMNLPLSENGFMGIANGAAMVGMRPVLVHARMDFLVLSMDQILNHAGQWKYVFNGRQKVPVTVRCIIARGWGSAAQHSQALHGLLLHVPGIKIVMPSNALDAKGLLLSSIADEDPVIFVEHRWLYNQHCHVPETPYVVPIGKGLVKREGKDLTVVTCSIMVHAVEQVAKLLFEKEGIDVEVIDSRTIKPMDDELIIESVKKTGRLLVVDSAWGIGGLASEVISIVSRKAFDHLKAPADSLTLPDIPTPASPALEEMFYISDEDIEKSIKKILSDKTRDTVR